MTDSASSIAGYVTALMDPTEEHLDALSSAMAPNVVVVGMVGAGQGLTEVREALARTQGPGLLSTATAAPPRVDGDSISVELALPAGAPIAGLVLHLSLDGEQRIVRVEQQMQGSSPPPARPLLLTDEIKQTIAGALFNGTPVLVAYVDTDGSPHISPRGSTQPYGDTQLALWVRDPGGGLLKGIATNPRMALFYRDPANRAALQFLGRARVASEPSERDAVYSNTPAPERNLDARRLGSAVIIDLDRVEGSGPSGRFVMER
jgi:hypothetical protein